MKQSALLLLLILLISGLLHFTGIVHAQLEVNDVYDVADKDATDGDILSIGNGKGIVRSNLEYDTRTFGVYNQNPLATFRRTDNTGVSISRAGTANVNVTTINGPIKQGDYIASSLMTGKGERAILSGTVVGVALADFNEGDGQKASYAPSFGTSKQVSVGKIAVAVKIEYVELNTYRNTNRFFDAINAALFSNVKDPEKFVNIIRYILAGLAILVSFLVGFFTLARTIPKGIEALGRNPLARASIQFGIILNISFTLLIAAIGIIAAVILLRF